MGSEIEASEEVGTWEWGKFFQPEELECRCGCKGLPTDEFMRILVDMRIKAGFPFVISSGYRCPEYNARVSKTGENGPHTTGMAADISVHGEQAMKVVGLAIEHNVIGLGIAQKGDFLSRFVHVDWAQMLERNGLRAIWTY